MATRRVIVSGHPNMAGHKLKIAKLPSIGDLDPASANGSGDALTALSASSDWWYADVDDSNTGLHLAMIADSSDNAVGMTRLLNLRADTEPAFELRFFDARAVGGSPDAAVRLSADYSDAGLATGGSSPVYVAAVTGLTSPKLLLAPLPTAAAPNPAAANGTGDALSPLTNFPDWYKADVTGLNGPHIGSITLSDTHVGWSRYFIMRDNGSPVFQTFLGDLSSILGVTAAATGLAGSSTTSSKIDKRRKTLRVFKGEGHLGLIQDKISFDVTSPQDLTSGGAGSLKFLEKYCDKTELADVVITDTDITALGGKVYRVSFPVTAAIADLFLSGRRMTHRAVVTHAASGIDYVLQAGDVEVF